MSNIESTPRLRARKRGLGLPVVIAGAVASLVLALSVSPSFAAFTASITNSTNTAGSGTVAMTESSGSVECTSTGDTTTCGTINKYGNQQMVPGQSVTTAVSIENTGTVPVSAFTLAPAACTTGNNPNSTVFGTGDLCTKMNLELKSGSTTIYSGTLAGFTASQDLYTQLGSTPIDVGDTVDFSFKVTLDSSANNTFAGRQVSQPMTWTFQAGA